MNPDEYLLTVIFLLLLNVYGAYYMIRLRRDVERHYAAMTMLNEQMTQLTLLVTEKPYEQDARLDRLDKEITAHIQLRHAGNASL